MEPDFIAELERTLTNVGTDVIWKKKIGKLELWISPLSVSGQEKVTAALDKATPGLNIVAESKKTTLANVIVGVNGMDFSEFRGTNQPVFPIKGRDGKTTNVALEKYLYEKMAGWSTDYLDDVFSVYADLMETFQKQNLKDIKFENTKDPHLELEELERKAAGLRAQLGLPPLVERKDEEEEAKEISPDDAAEALAAEQRLNEDGTEEGRDKGKAGDFDPFRPVPQEQQAAVIAQAQAQAATPPPQPPPQPQPVQTGPRQPPPPSAQPQPTMGMPVALPPNLRRPMPPGQQPQESSPDRPLTATPSVQNEVLERPAERAPVRPKIDQVPANTNPRFQQQRR